MLGDFWELGSSVDGKKWVGVVIEEISGSKRRVSVKTNWVAW